MNIKKHLPWLLAPVILTFSMISHGRHNDAHPKTQINEFFLQHYDEGMLKKVLQERCPAPRFNENTLNMSHKKVNDHCVEILSASLMQFQRKIHNKAAFNDDYDKSYQVLKSELKVTEIDLSNNYISDDGVAYLYQALLKNDLISVVDLRNNPFISIEGKIWLKMLQKLNPNIQILF